jgi:hypothetical protein
LDLRGRAGWRHERGGVEQVGVVYDLAAAEFEQVADGRVDLLAAAFPIAWYSVPLFPAKFLAFACLAMSVVQLVETWLKAIRNDPEVGADSRDKAGLGLRISRHVVHQVYRPF